MDTRIHLVTAPDLEHEFVRINWVSSSARAAWEPVFSECSNFFESLQLESVKQGIRGATIATCPASDMDLVTVGMMKENLVVMPLGKIQVSGIYQSSSSDCDISKPWNYKVVVGKFEDVREIVYAYKNDDYITIGHILGYPQCCVAFFGKTWVTEKWLDTSYPMSNDVIEHRDWSPYCNILLRWLGLRFVPHLPCSFYCEGTKTFGKKLHNLAILLGKRTVADRLLEILSWPIEWSALHGIGIISTPVCRITVRTDMLNEKRTIKLFSNTYPSESAYGLVFPFKSRGSCQDNGFSDILEQTRAHNLILDLLRGYPPASAIDFGCGNMDLLSKIHSEFGSSTFGIDAVADKEPNLVADIWSIDYLPQDFDVALISVARIRENPLGWIKLLKVISQYCKSLLLYSYNKDSEASNPYPFIPLCGISDNNYVATLYVKPHV